MYARVITADGSSKFDFKNLVKFSPLTPGFCAGRAHAGLCHASS